MNPFASHLGRFVVRPRMTSLELPIRWSFMCRGSLLMAQHTPASSPIWRVGFFESILSAIFRSSFSPYHRPLAALASPFLLTAHDPLKYMVVWGVSKSLCSWGLAAGRRDFASGSVKTLKQSSSLGVVHIDGLKVIIPFSFFLSSSFFLMCCGVSDSLSLLSLELVGLNLGGRDSSIVSAALTHTFGSLHPSLLSLEQPAHWQSFRSWCGLFGSALLSLLVILSISLMDLVWCLV